MNPLLLAVLVVFGGAAGWIGWHRATRAVYRRSYGTSDAPRGEDRRRHEFATIMRRKRWRIVTTAAYAVGGMILGLMFLVLISRR